MSSGLDGISNFQPKQVIKKLQVNLAGDAHALRDYFLWKSFLISTLARSLGSTLKANRPRTGAELTKGCTHFCPKRFHEEPVTDCIICF